MGEYESNMRYARSVGADVSKPTAADVHNGLYNRIAALEAENAELKGADETVKAIERLIPTWKSHRDLVEAVEVNLNHNKVMFHGWRSECYKAKEKHNETAKELSELREAAAWYDHCIESGYPPPSLSWKWHSKMEHSYDVYKLMKIREREWCHTILSAGHALRALLKEES